MNEYSKISIPNNYVKFKKVYLENERSNDTKLSAWINGSREDFYFYQYDFK